MRGELVQLAKESDRDLLLSRIGRQMSIDNEV